MDKKYELTSEALSVGDHMLYRIKAVKDFANVKKGDLGGFVESEDNLSHEGDCWIFNDATVYGSAQVCGDAEVFDNAEVLDNASIYGNAKICGKLIIGGVAKCRSWKN